MDIPRSPDVHAFREMRCPACGKKATLVKYQERFDTNGRDVELHICTGCTALVNVTDLLSSFAGVGNYDRQKAGSENFYAVDKDSLNPNKVAADVDARVGMIEYALSQLPITFKTGVFADLGAGSGYLAAAAARYFDRVYAIDFNTTSLHTLYPYFEHREKIVIADKLVDVSGLDMVVMWHTLEHLPNALMTLKEVQRKLNSGGAIFFQCPMLRPEYVVSTHYTFFGEFSVRAMCDRAGFRVIRISYDKEYDFITCLAIKKERRSLISWVSK
jgi:SAM-dependent methyltransferase